MRAMHAMQNQPPIRVGWPDITRKSVTQLQQLHNTHLSRRSITDTTTQRQYDAKQTALAAFLQTAARFSELQHPVLWMWRIRYKYGQATLPRDTIRLPLYPWSNSSGCVEPWLHVLFGNKSAACPVCGQIYNQKKDWVTTGPLEITGVHTYVPPTGNRYRLFTPCREGCIAIAFTCRSDEHPHRWRNLQARLLHATPALRNHGDPHAKR